MMLNMMYFYKFCGIFLLNWHLLVNFVWHLLANFTWHILLISRGIHFGICLLISHDIISHSITFCVEFILWHSLTSNFVWHLFTNFAWHSLANFAWHSLQLLISLGIHLLILHSITVTYFFINMHPISKSKL